MLLKKHPHTPVKLLKKYIGIAIYFLKIFGKGAGKPFYKKVFLRDNIWKKS